MWRSRRVWIGLAFSLILIVLFLHGTNFRDIGQAFGDANYLLAFLSLPVYFVAAWFRTLRWKYLLRPTKAVSTARLYPVVIIGFMANNLIPARVGELVRAYILREREGVSMSTGLGTIVVDRVFDGLTLLLFLILAGLFATVSTQVRTLAIVMAAFFGVGVVIMYVLVTSESRSKWAVDVVVRLLPGRLKGRAQRVADSFLEGLQALRSPAAMAGAWVASVVSWLLEATMYYMVGEAFGLGLGFHVYLLVTAAANLAITLPTPGGVGPFELGTRWALAPFAVATDTVRAYAIALHALLLFPVIALGLIFLWSINLSLGDMLRRPAAQSASTGSEEPTTSGRSGAERGASRMKVAVVGGGVAGLAAAHRLLQEGHHVSLLEAGPSLGGLVRTVEVGGGRLEAFYHHLFRSDTTIIRLIDELGLGDRMTWRDSMVGFFQGGRIHDFVTPFDLLRFRPLPPLDRVRLGLMALRLRREESWEQFENVTAREWIETNVSRRVFDVVWGPLLKGKFGEAADEVSMAWLWSKIHLRFASRRGGPMQKEQLGYLMGSFGVYIDELGRRLRDGGADVRVGTPVQEVTVEDGRASGLLLAGGERVPADAIVAAMPSHAFERLVPALPGDYRAKLTAVRWQWALCMVLALRESLSPIYWLNIAEPGMPFLAVIEHTNYIEREQYGGQHVVYISNYLRPDHPYFDLSEEQLWELFLPALQRINPRFSADWVRERWLFKGPYAQPIVTTGYRSLIPDHRTPIPGLYLATMSQIYPEDRGQNYSVLMGERVADMAMEDLAKRQG